jgi:hypothetical protein
MKTMNQSIVKLKEKDLIDEPERKIRFQANLKVNPNLDKAYQPTRTKG